MKYENEQQCQRDAKPPHAENADKKWAFDVCGTTQRTGKNATGGVERLRDGNNPQHSCCQWNHRFIAGKKPDQRFGKHEQQDPHKDHGAKSG